MNKQTLNNSTGSAEDRKYFMLPRKKEIKTTCNTLELVVWSASRSMCHPLYMHLHFRSSTLQACYK